MQKPRRKPMRGDEAESGRDVLNSLPIATPLYPFGAFPMTPPVFPNTGINDLPEQREEDYWDL